MHEEKKIFYNLKKNISINKVNGISDLNRIEVIEENIKILNLNNLILASKKLSKIKFLNHLKIFLKKFINKKSIKYSFKDKIFKQNYKFMIFQKIKYL